MTSIDDSIDTAAAAWLALTDAGDARASWDASGAVFRDAMTVEDWGAKLREARGPLGAWRVVGYFIR